MKKMNLNELEQGSRTNRGVLMLRELKGNPHRIIGMKMIDTDLQLAIITATGAIEIINSAELRFNDRYSNGSFIVDVQSREKLLIS